MSPIKGSSRARDSSSNSQEIKSPVVCESVPPLLSPLSPRLDLFEGLDSLGHYTPSTFSVPGVKDDSGSDFAFNTFSYPYESSIQGSSYAHEDSTLAPSEYSQTTRTTRTYDDVAYSAVESNTEDREFDFSPYKNSKQTTWTGGDASFLEGIGHIGQNTDVTVSPTEYYTDAMGCNGWYCDKDEILDGSMFDSGTEKNNSAIQTIAPSPGTVRLDSKGQKSRVMPTLYSTRSELSRNRRGPLRSPAMACSECSKSYKNKSELKRHRAKHSKPFTCPLAFAGCKSKFSSKNEWLRHISTIHERRFVYKCNQNGCRVNPFNRRDLFKCHMTRVHKLAENEELEHITNSCFVNAQDLTWPTRIECSFETCRKVFGGTSESDQYSDATWKQWLEHRAEHHLDENTWALTRINDIIDDSVKRWATMKGVKAGKMERAETISR